MVGNAVRAMMTRMTGTSSKILLMEPWMRNVLLASAGCIVVGYKVPEWGWLSSVRHVNNSNMD